MSSVVWPRVSRTFLFLVLALIVVISVQTASAEVRYFDGFGDGDRDNNGEVLGRTDVDMNRDALRCMMGLGDPCDPADGLGTSYEPDEFPGMMVTEISSVLDANDTGIRWLHSRGWSSTANPPRPPERDPKANIKIMDDSLGMMPDSTHATYPVQSLDSGYALGWDSKGRGSSATAFFGSGTGTGPDPWVQETVALGTEVGDQVKVSFDFRVWLSGPAGNDFTPPRVASLRFGLFQDTDDQIGMTNSIAGPDFTPAVWGEEGGQFRGDFGTVGATEDRGWYTHIDMGRTDFTGVPNFDPADFSGTGARINEETNTVASGGKFLEGNDNDFVAKTDTMAPAFTALDVTKNYNLALTLERATDETTGDTIKAIYTVTELLPGGATGTSWTIEGTEPIMRDDGMGGMIPDGISSDSWDYFGIRNTTPLESDGDDFDFLLDNFKLEIFGSNAAVPNCDFNGDSMCDDMDINMLTAEVAAGTNNLDFDLNGDNQVDVDDITDPDDGWLRLAGEENLGEGLSYLEGDATLDGFVDGQDFIAWNSNKFTGDTDWTKGNFNGDGFVDGQDFIIWNGNKFTDSFSAAAAVPEPSSMSLMMLLVCCGLGLRRR